MSQELAHGFVVENCPDIASVNGRVFAPDGERKGRPLYRCTAEGSKAAMYWNESLGKWIIHTAFSEEDAKKGLGHILVLSQDGTVPLGAGRKWQCPVDGKWQDRSMRVVPSPQQRLANTARTQAETVRTAMRRLPEFRVVVGRLTNCVVTW